MKARSRPTQALVPLFCRVTTTVKAAIEQAARSAGKGEGELLRELLADALAPRQVGGLPLVDEAQPLLERLGRLEARIDDIGVSSRSAVRLLAHWAAQSGAVRVSEDELLAELRAVGRDEWEQAFEEEADADPNASTSSARAGRDLE
jgi:hypothetical protein